MHVAALGFARNSDGTVVQNAQGEVVAGCNVHVVDPATGNRIERVVAADTDEGWLKILKPREILHSEEDHSQGCTGRCKIRMGTRVKATVFMDYDLVDRRNGQILAQVRHGSKKEKGN